MADKVKTDFRAQAVQYLHKFQDALREANKLPFENQNPVLGPENAANLARMQAFTLMAYERMFGEMAKAAELANRRELALSGPQHQSPGCGAFEAVTRVVEADAAGGHHRV